jgi:CheY-like chemotaxis protein
MMDGFKYKNVFLIDDSYIDNLINKKILENEKFAQSITLIDNPIEAFQLIKTALENGQLLPEVIFLDLRMPMMNGFEFLNSLMEIPGLEPDKIKIYILTSSLDPTDIKQIKENPMVSKFIGKPLSKQSIQEI